MNHCVETIVRIVAHGGDDRRSVFQLGYNLGRLSELSGLGRGPFWDRWKDAVSTWDLPRLQTLARELQAWVRLESAGLGPESRPGEPIGGLDPGSPPDPHAQP